MASCRRVLIPKSYATRPWKISRFLHDHDKIDLGGRTLEVLSTPGHTPDAISLLDRANGLLFTGDTFYPAPIWLYRPETNLDQYVASVKRLAALAPQIKLVLGQHNVPFAEPSVLPRLVVAIETVRAGKVPAEPHDAGKAIYRFDGFSFLLKAPAPQSSAASADVGGSCPPLGRGTPALQDHSRGKSSAIAAGDVPNSGVTKYWARAFSHSTMLKPEGS